MRRLRAVNVASVTLRVAFEAPRRAGAPPLDRTPPSLLGDA